MLVANQSIVDLRKEPKDLHPRDYSHNNLRLTQLLYGENMRILEEHCDYFFVESLEQEHYTSREGWHGYRGFVHAGEVIFDDQEKKKTHVVDVPWTNIGGIPLSFGTYLALDEEGKVLLNGGKKAKVEKKDLRPLHSPFCRERIIHDTRYFIGVPYLWGGKSAFSNDLVSSVDCSGLIYLLYRAQGILIPRDAHPQSLKGRRIKQEELQPGDLIYLSRTDNPGVISHVLLYKNQKTFLESPCTGENVREGTFETDFQKGILRGTSFIPTYVSFF